MGRPRGFREEVVLESAAEAFVHGGYEATSVDDLVQRLGLHRGSLYQAFGSKRGLFLAALRHHIRTKLTAGPGSLRPGGSTAFQVGAVADSSRLDLLLVAALERGHSDAEVAVAVRGALTDLEQAIDSDLPVPRSTDTSARPVRALGLLADRLYERLI